MRPEPELLSKIAAHPEDPAPRLAGAEWFEKHGEGSRAELIRAQLALRTRVDPAKRNALKARVEALLKQHLKPWEAEFPEARYSRGFIEELEFTEARLAEQGEELLTREPVFRLHVQVQDGKGLEKVAAQPWFERIRWLKLTGKGDAGVRSLAVAPHVGKLESLLVPGATSKGLAALAKSEGLQRLRMLSLTGSDALDGESLAPLVQGAFTLERLFLTGLQFEEGLGDWVEAERLQSLKWLALNRAGLTDDDAKALANSEPLQNLERLELARNELSEAGGLVFRSAKVMPRLTHLDLSGIYYDARKFEPLRKRLGPGLKL
ncbi:TIGR02996 domain-containing protein [Hyalangium rubrum]|uniref:TIGR02996 domain-containing protein n=1 Tax=Hyalangium rubrum TaxID=3103134 RepID=A0ABU5HCG8_9BACT|nr:TIGR02996 domain-containing protein [Hyalangium sp. s54d21]MDY7230842.1 TIGR02996 domain-containing protein [Hyalangium sp. s54d21]